MKHSLMKIKKMLSLTKKRVTHLIQKLIKYKEVKANNIIDLENYSNTFVFVNGFNKNAILIDVGCAEDADLSVAMMERYSVKCFGVDPTKKHFAALNKLEKKSNGMFTHLPYALGSINEELTFFESLDNQSGSLRDDHINIRNDEINEYKVKCLTIPNLLSIHGISKADYFKIDIEGAEYDLISNLKEDDLNDINQLFVEFHHRHIPEYSISDTLNCVEKIKSMGFKSFSFDKKNYLFFR